MTSQQNDTNNFVYACVDEKAIPISNTKKCTCLIKNTVFYHVVTRVGRSGLPSPPFEAQPVICVVCTC